jgi:hypothetical protein
LQRRPELGDLGVTAGQHWTGDSSDHATDHPRCRIEGLTPQPGAAAGTAGAPTCGGGDGRPSPAGCAARGSGAARRPAGGPRRERTVGDT